MASLKNYQFKGLPQTHWKPRSENPAPRSRTVQALVSACSFFMAVNGGAGGTPLPGPIGQLDEVTLGSTGPPTMPMESPSADQATAERRLAELMAEVDELASQLSRTTLLAAADHLHGLAAARTAQAGGEDGSPLQPAQLTFANLTGVVMLPLGGDAGSDDSLLADDDAQSSVRSAAALGWGDDNSECGECEPEEPEAQWEAVDPRAEAAGIEPLLWDAGLWAPAPVDWEALGFGGNSGAGDLDESALGVRETRLVPGADPLGLARHGRKSYCDYHDLGGGSACACMAVDMLQQRRIAAIIEKHRHRRQKKPHEDPDGREARHALYKAVVAWQWANPLGAENRVRLPCCVMYRVRKLFPNPICGGDCDYLEGCERAGHYTGFRTAEESRAVREGRFDTVDMR